MFPPSSTAGEQHGQEGVWTELKGLQQHGSAGERRGWNIGSELSCTSLGTKAHLAAFQILPDSSIHAQRRQTSLDLRFPLLAAVAASLLPRAAGSR